MGDKGLQESGIFQEEGGKRRARAVTSPRPGTEGMFILLMVAWLFSPGDKWRRIFVFVKGTRNGITLQAF